MANISSYSAPDFYKTRSLSEYYIFYEKLKFDHNEYLQKTYTSVKKRLQNYIETRANFQEIGDRLISLAYTEFIKEQKYLSDKFQMSLTNFYDLDNSQEFNKVLTLFNTTLNFKEVFERNIHRILTYDKGEKIDVSSFGTSYFSKGMRLAFQKQIDNLIKDVENGVDIETAIDNYSTQICDEAGIEGLNQMFNSINSVRKKPELADMHKAYEQFLTDVEQQTPEILRLSKELYDLYDLDELLIHIKTELSKIQDQQILLDTLEKMKANRGSVNGLYKKVAMNRNRTGYTHEFLREFLRAKIDQTLNGNGRASESIEMGPQLARGDLINFEYSIQDGPKIQSIKNQIINAGVFKTSTQAMDFFVNISKRMENITDGWITYENAKSAFMPKFEEGKSTFTGFHGGSPRQLTEWYSRIGTPEKVGAIYQTIHGAIGEDLEDKLTTSLAEDIAYFLFDDFQKKIPGSNITTKNSLHLFNLDAIIVPLSYLLYHLGKAFKDSVIDPLEIVTVNIEKPDSIRFPNAPYDYGIFAGRAWDEQRDIAIAETKVSFTFFNDIFDLIRGGFKN